MSKKFIVGVMGQGNNCPDLVAQSAYQLGALIAKEGWVLLNGGRDLGVMDAVNKGAKSENGLTIGIIPNTSLSVSTAVDIVIQTDVGLARNNINVISSDIVIACGIGPGTASEICLALCAKKKIILLHASQAAINFFQELNPNLIFIAENPVAAIEQVKKLK